MNRLPPLNSLRAFEAAGRLESFREAADELHVTPAAISYQIRSLEAQLGVSLFHRRGKGLALTSAGRAYFPVIQDIFMRLADATKAVFDNDAPSLLTVNALPTFASSWLVPRIWKFHEMFPDIEIEIQSNRTLGVVLDFAREEADIAIRGGIGETDWPGLYAEKLVHEEMFPVCSPVLFTGRDKIVEPEDLATHTLLSVSSAPEGWNDWLAEAKRLGYDVEGIDPSHGLRFDTVQMAMDACAQGRGVVMGRRPLVDLYLESGRLVAPFDFSITSKIAYWLVGPEHNIERQSVASFRSWIRFELGIDKSEPLLQAVDLGR